MRLDPGSYVVKSKGIVFGEYHILRVKRMGRDIFWQFDAGLPYLVSKDQEILEMENFKIVKQLKKKMEYKKCEVEVRFTDEDGHEFILKAKNEVALERIKEQFQRLWDNFRYFK